MKYLKVDIPLSQEDFNKIKNKIEGWGIKFYCSLDIINGYEFYLKKYTSEKLKRRGEPFIYKKFNSISSSQNPPQKYNTDKIRVIDGKEINLEEFLKL